MSDDKFVIVNGEVFDELAKDAVPAKSPLTGFVQDDGQPCPAMRAWMPSIEIVTDRFGVVSPGKALVVQVPVRMEFPLPVMLDPPVFDELAQAYRYIGVALPRWLTGPTPKKRPNIWVMRWRRSSLKTREHMHRRLDRQSNVRRRKRASELQRRHKT